MNIIQHHPDRVVTYFSGGYGFAIIEPEPLRWYFETTSAMYNADGRFVTLRGSCYHDIDTIRHEGLEYGFNECIATINRYRRNISRDMDTESTPAPTHPTKPAREWAHRRLTKYN